MAGLVARWVRLYTRQLPGSVAQRRIDEIDADLHDHIAHERAGGTSDRRISFSIVSRMLRGLPADMAWRGAQETTHRYRPVVRVVLATACILLLPLVAMRFTGEVVWSLGDFVVAGTLLVGTGLTLDLAVRKARSSSYRFAAVVALAAAFLLIWLTLAVGIIGEPGEPANAMYVGVLVVGIAGAIIARFRPSGMALALLATAVAQATVAAIALVARHAQSPAGSAEIVVLNGLFVTLFIGSAWLFRHAARQRRHARPSS